MVEVFKCSYCGEIFDTKEECIEHENKFHDSMHQLKDYIYELIYSLSEKYNRRLSITNITIQKDDYYFNVSFLLNNEYLIRSEIYDKDDLKSLNDEVESILIETTKSIEGKMEIFTNAYGRDVFMLGDVSLNEYFEKHNGKKIKVEIID